MAAKDDFLSLSELADRLGLDDDEKDGFITSSMKRLGHKPSVNWEDGDSGNSNDSGDFFSKKRQTRQVGNNRNQNQNRGSGMGWQYEGSGS